MRSTLGSVVLLASALHPEAQAQDPEVSKPNILLIVAVRSLSTAASAIDLESCDRASHLRLTLLWMLGSRAATG